MTILGAESGDAEKLPYQHLFALAHHARHAVPDSIGIRATSLVDGEASHSVRWKVPSLVACPAESEHFWDMACSKALGF